eukprot:83045-Hanusia_phi.AAC.3
MSTVLACKPTASQKKWRGSEDEMTTYQRRSVAWPPGSSGPTPRSLHLPHTPHRACERSEAGGGAGGEEREREEQVCDGDVASKREEREEVRAERKEREHGACAT